MVENIKLNKKEAEALLEYLPESLKVIIVNKLKGLESRRVKEHKRSLYKVKSAEKYKKTKIIKSDLHKDAIINSAILRRQDLITKQTESEKIFKAKLKALGIQYEFQKIIYYKASYYIVDFYLPKYGLIIELDDGYHTTKEQKTKDKNRTNQLAALGYNRLKRYTNEQGISILEYQLKDNIESYGELEVLNTKLA